MAADRKTTHSIPPKTEDIDVDWSDGYLDEEPTIPGVIPGSQPPGSSALPPYSESQAPYSDSVPPDSERPTRVPSEPIEEIARRLMAQLPVETERGVLSSPSPESGRSAPPARGGMNTVPDAAAGTYDRAFAPAANPDRERSARGVSDFGLALDLPDDQGSALDLVGVRSPEPPPQIEISSSPAEDTAALEMRDRYAVGDFTGALVMAEAVLETEPDNGEAQRYAATCRDVLVQMYTARLGSTELVPKLALTADQIRWLTLDHRAGFLLSCIDGRSSVEELLDVCGMPPLDALRILCELVQQNVISLGPGR